MRKPQRNSAWEARLSVLRQGLRRSFALSHTALLSGRVQWKAASCNGKPYRATESPIVQWKAAQRAMERWILQKLIFTLRIIRLSTAT